LDTKSHKKITNIAEYIEQYSAIYASIIVKKLYNKVIVLKKFPKIRRVIPEMQEERY
jgi:hypothetical protein